MYMHMYMYIIVHVQHVQYVYLLEYDFFSHLKVVLHNASGGDTDTQHVIQ